MPPTIDRTALRTAIPLRYPGQREFVLRILDRWARTAGYLVVPPGALEAPGRP